MFFLAFSSCERFRISVEKEPVNIRHLARYPGTFPSDLDIKKAGLICRISGASLVPHIYPGKPYTSFITVGGRGEPAGVAGTPRAREPALQQRRLPHRHHIPGRVSL